MTLELDTLLKALNSKAELEGGLSVTDSKKLIKAVAALIDQRNASLWGRFEGRTSLALATEQYYNARILAKLSGYDFSNN